MDMTLYKHIRDKFVQFNRKTKQHPKSSNNLNCVIQSTARNSLGYISIKEREMESTLIFSDYCN